VSQQQAFALATTAARISLSIRRGAEPVWTASCVDSSGVSKEGKMAGCPCSVSLNSSKHCWSFDLQHDLQQGDGASCYNRDGEASVNGDVDWNV